MHLRPMAAELQPAMKLEVDVIRPNMSPRQQMAAPRLRFKS
jgi:hypothetical protein